MNVGDVLTIAADSDLTIHSPIMVVAFRGWFDIAEAGHQLVPSRRLRTPYAPRGPPRALL